MSHERTELERVARRYNPENDIPACPDVPDVTFTDYTLIECVRELYRRVESLERSRELDFRGVPPPDHLKESTNDREGRDQEDAGS